MQAAGLARRWMEISRRSVRHPIEVDNAEASPPPPVEPAKPAAALRAHIQAPEPASSLRVEQLVQQPAPAAPELPTPPKAIKLARTKASAVPPAVGPSLLCNVLIAGQVDIKPPDVFTVERVTDKFVWQGLVCILCVAP